MFLLKYLNGEKEYSVDFLMMSENIVQVTGDFPINTVGFELSRLPEDVDGLPEEQNDTFWDGWDYSAFTTVYREIDGGVQFSNDGSVYVEPEPEPEPEPYVPTLEEVQEMKVAEMEAIKQQLIRDGFDVILTNGTVEHFTLTAEEQTELSALRQMVKDGVDELHWQTNDEDEHCKFYDNADMSLIIDAAFAHKSWHRTYFQDLRIYIRSLDSKEAVEAVTYGMEIPEEYRGEPLQAMMAAQNDV